MSSKARSSAASNRKDPPRKSKEAEEEAVSATTEPTSIASLPYDLLLNCLARVSRLYYPALSRVSKKFRYIVTSPEIYTARSLLNCTEKCLYLCLHFPSQNPTCTHWFTLYQNPNRNASNKSSGKVLVQIPSPKYPLTQSSNLVAVGSNIYKIGGTVGNRDPSSKVSVLDCLSHTWRDAPSMRLDRSSSTASLVDGKVYVTGGSKYHNSSNWIEVFDPKTQSWGSVTNPRIKNLCHVEESYRRVVKSVGLEGKLYLFGDEFVVYNPEESTWNPVGVDVDYQIVCALCSSYCVIDNILFFWERGLFRWYDREVSSWKELKGVEGLPDFRHRNCKLVDLGGKMAVLWDTCECSEAHMILCAEISIEKRDGDEIWGKIEWFDSVLAIGVSCSLINADALSASV